MTDNKTTALDLEPATDLSEGTRAYFDKCT